MSAQVRQALADAVNTVPGLNCSPYYRQATKPGAAMVRRDRTTRSDNGYGYVVTWQIVVLLPQDLATAETWLDEHVPALLDALAPEMWVSYAEPQQLALDTGAVPILLIAGNREE